MDVTAAKYIGAGLAMTGLIGAGAGLGILFGNYLQAAMRNPAAAAAAHSSEPNQAAKPAFHAESEAE